MALRKQSLIGGTHTLILKNVFFGKHIDQIVFDLSYGDAFLIFGLPGCIVGVFGMNLAWLARRGYVNRCWVVIFSRLICVLYVFARVCMEKDCFLDFEKKFTPKLAIYLQKFLGIRKN